MPAITSADRDRGYERCVVTFIDILGYRHLLETRQASEIVEVLQALREFTAGDANERPPPRRMAEVRLNAESFSEAVSDAVVRARPVEIQAPDGAFVHELIDLVHAIVACVSHDILVRGGLTIGPAHVGLAGKGPIFGPAMVRAYEIERDEAVYPRIMIDDDAVAQYLSDTSLWRYQEHDAWEAELARSLIGIAEDGSFFVDYLKGAGPGEFDDGELGQFSFLRQHHDLIASRLPGAKGSVRRKLIWLANYHNRFIVQLRARYDETDPEGAFAAAVGMPPHDLFDALVIGGLDDLSRQLAETAAM